MSDIKGQRLHVFLSASQVRRRLKGLGFGVKKVQSADRNEAVVIHTATGEHRRELLAIFADVLPRDDDKDKDKEKVLPSEEQRDG